MFGRLRRPSPALVVAVIALFVALTGTAVAAGIVPLAKRALVADNANKLQGKTAPQVAALAPAPAPVTSVGGLVSVRSAPWALNPQTQGTFTVTCDPNQKALSVAWSDPGDYASSYQNQPTANGQGWTIELYVSSRAPGQQSGNVLVICLK